MSHISNKGEQSTDDEISLIAELYDLANSATNEYIRKVNGSFINSVVSAGGVSAHNLLTGLTNDDHTQYLLANGTRALTGDWNVGSFKITAQNINISSLTALELIATDGSKNLQSLAIATYPSLAELAFVKGVTSAIQTQLDSKQGTLTNSAGLAAALNDETGTGLAVFSTNPVFTTSIITPLVIGGTGTTSDLVLQTTSGVGATGADMHFLVGNNGAIEPMTIENSGNIIINEAGNNTDFRIESDLEANMFFIDANGSLDAKGSVHIGGYSASTYGKLNLYMPASGLYGLYIDAATAPLDMWLGIAYGVYAQIRTDAGNTTSHNTISAMVGEATHQRNLTSGSSRHMLTEAFNFTATHRPTIAGGTAPRSSATVYKATLSETTTNNAAVITTGTMKGLDLIINPVPKNTNAGGGLTWNVYGADITINSFINGASVGTNVMNIYGLKINADGNTIGTSKLYGLYVEANGADTNYGAYINNLVGIGTASTPTELLEVQNANATTCIQISNTATDGDPILAFALSGTKTFTMGVDDGDSDKFKIGTTAIGTNTRLTIDSAGLVGIGTDAPTHLLDINSDNIRIRTAKTPASATDTGTQGQIAWDANFIYVCTLTNVWVRAALVTW